MSASGSRLAPLLSQYDLRVACTQCCFKEKQITYMLKSINHKCVGNLLFCRAKGGSNWRPVSERPKFPIPSRYEVCVFFIEGSGCVQHKNRCTFASSTEEAAVWTFEKRHGLDRPLLCHLITLSAGGSDQPVNDIFETLDLKLVCNLCCVKQNETAYTVQHISHNCHRELLVVKAKMSDIWRPVCERPKCGHFGQNVLYKKCDFFVEGSGCTKHGAGCTFATSLEEAAVWNYVRDKKIDHDELIRLVTDSESVSVTPESAAEQMLQQFSGKFIELCKACFCSRPQRLTAKKWNATCSADEAHPWDPVLVHYLAENSEKHIYSQVRPLPQNCKFTFCNHIKNGKPCWHPAGHCKAAQSVVEMAVWKAEHSGLTIRPHLLRSLENTESRQNFMYCKVCLLVLSSPERFYKHCSSLEHAQLLSEDTTTKWTGRKPPHNIRDKLWLCDRPHTCEYGDNCPKAHSEEELQEWMMRSEEETEIRRNIEDQGLMSYSERLLEEYRTSRNDSHVLSEQIENVSISCDEDLTIRTEQVDTTLQWNFQVETERQLIHVALLKQEPGATFSLGHMHPTPCIYSSGEHFLSGDTTYDISVHFTSINPGLYEQWLVLDFDMRPVLLKKLRVRVGQMDDSEEQAVNHGAMFQRVERWHPGNRVIIPCLPRTEEQEKLLKDYKPPQISLRYKPTTYNSQTPLNHDNYKERMHHFLYNEECSEDQVISRLNVCGSITTQDKLYGTHIGMKIAPEGQVFCAVSIPCNLTPDTPEGQALKRSIQSALVAPLSSSVQNSKVYEAIILQDTTSENKMYLELSRKCCSALALKSNESYQMEVQFQHNRLSFCTMHRAVDLLPDMKRVLPDLKNCGVPVKNVDYENAVALNMKQQTALDFITGDSSSRKFVAPLLIYGPFGTGKTFTLATAARELSKQPDSKVLICTRTNSSADLYVRDYFHPLIDNNTYKLRPIRIKANKQGISKSSTDQITLKYCYLSQDGQYFLLPTKAVLDRHNIVITTTSLATHFHDLNLPEGYFSHIFIDEASQMLECDALNALGLAGSDTRVVLAGDHMQMGPKLFSVDDHHRSNHTLLNRLFHYYQGQKCDAAQNSRVIFSENYRSTKEIVDFLSTHLYVGKNDIIRAIANIPAPENGRALKFHHVRGECRLDTVSMSWYNKEEVATVVEEVKDVLEYWPLSWGMKDPSSICVLSEGCQVRQIRRALFTGRLSEVNVENIANVQGKQFRAVILTAVQTRDSLKQSHLPGLELFNDVRVLNTAMTRAQSCVIVIGDAAGLCCFGKCSGVWKTYTDHCISNNSIAPQHFTKAFFEKDIMETVRFQKPELVDDSNNLNDAVLQELKDEYKQLTTEYSSDEDKLDPEDVEQHKAGTTDISDIETDLLELCKKQPEVYKHGKFFRESYNKGYVIPFENPSRRINIKGRANLGMVFTGDEVVLQTVRVVSITKEEQSSRVLVCLLEDEDHSKKDRSEYNFIRRTMVPITKAAPKVNILISKKRRNFIPIWEQIDGRWMVAAYEPLNEKLKENSVFVVQVIGWKERCYLPLGNVVSIIPIGRSLEDGLRILNEEFKVTPTTDTSDEEFSLEDKNGMYRQDICDVFTFTVDPEYAEDLDDAISVKEIGDHYELGIHIADVVSFVGQGDKLDEYAKQRRTTFYNSGGKNNDMFPKELSCRHFSLLSGHVRNVVSLLFEVKKETDEIIRKPKFQLSKIMSDRQLSYEEAEEIISKGYQKTPTFDTVEGCVAVAYRFAKVQRKKRLADWAYSQPDGHRMPGKRKANLMIEELNVLFNTFASETLINSVKTESCTPLRCQKRPDPEKIEEFKKNKCADLIPLSFHVRYKVDHDNQVSNSDSFRIMTKVWEDIQSAARADDVDKMVDLIAADDIHPLLRPVTDAFRKCYSKAYIICSNSSPKARVGHYSLNVTSYTRASSPIRRYMDIVLQRLLHAVICNRQVPYTQKDISALCSQFESDIKNVKEYKQKAEQISYAVSMKTQSNSKIAFVVSVASNRDSFAVSFPFNKNIFAESLSITYRDLQLSEQPLFDEANSFVTLTWKRRIYTVDTMQIYRELKMPDCCPHVELPLKMWRETLGAIDKEDWTHAKSCVLSINTSQMGKPNILPQTPCFEERELPGVQWGHEVDISLQLWTGDTLYVQMTSEIRRGYQMPTVQLVRIKPHFEICVDHVHSPITCFSRPADDPSRIHYSDPHEYIRIWRPMCEMESASTAVDEGDSIIINNLVVDFWQEQERMLMGSFFLPVAWINEWAIECNLSKCLLCIRKMGLKPTTLIHSALVDPREFTWVAHGVTTQVAKVQDPPNQGSIVEFYVNHLPMENIPICVFEKNTRFTVEIIPKLLPNIRTESAVISITCASNLVQAIALGKRIPKEVKSDWNRKKPPAGLPKLNLSQQKAVDTALNDTFTLIWGPPGTGKTVVGVYIVYCFFMLNSQNQRKYVDPNDEKKKQVILYCGPSNKSVDVVAQYLLRFEHSLRPLRVYGQQVEMLDYPYPDCTFQFSQKAFRKEQAKPELRSITLHHRMRQKENPYSTRIKDFDKRIKVALEKKANLKDIQLCLQEKEALRCTLAFDEMEEHHLQLLLLEIEELKHRQRALEEIEELTEEDAKEYKNLLRDARIHEFERHDIILCTCSQSSSPSLTKTVSARQVIIDECAMATEPQALIPLVCNKPEKIVLIGDPKQLRPIVKNVRVRKLGMTKSLFERYFDMHKKRVVMLDTQYRMHKDICKFPSKEFYEENLHTGAEQPSSLLCVNTKIVPFVFGHIEGTAVSLIVHTAKGNENSKANHEERNKVIDVAEKLVTTGRIRQQSIVILSPYNAQVSEIKEELKKKKMDQITVTTITKSQGSEWRYVIISTVCSVADKDIESEPDGVWLSKHLGFVGDPNQINVAITRAKEGLCIIGNQKLLRCSKTWRKLLEHYTSHSAVTDADNISVRVPDQ